MAIHDRPSRCGDGAGVANVLINGWPAARVTDKHVCLMPPSAGPHPPSTIVKGSTTVLIDGQPAARIGDSAGVRRNDHYRLAQRV